MRITDKRLRGRLAPIAEMAREAGLDWRESDGTIGRAGAIDIESNGYGYGVSITTKDGCSGVRMLSGTGLSAAECWQFLDGMPWRFTPWHHGRARSMNQSNRASWRCQLRTMAACGRQSHGALVSNGQTAHLAWIPLLPELNLMDARPWRASTFWRIVGLAIASLQCFPSPSGWQLLSSWRADLWPSSN